MSKSLMKECLLAVNEDEVIIRRLSSVKKAKRQKNEDPAQHLARIQTLQGGMGFLAARDYLNSLPLPQRFALLAQIK